MTERVLRIVAAAGQGQRMQATKALLDLRGQSALERIVRLKLPGFEMSTLVILGHDAAAVAAEAARLGAESVLNQHWQAGQTGSIQTGLQAANSANYGRFLLHPVDLPLIDQSTYDALATKLLATPKDQVVATSVEMRRGHPLVFGASLRQQILALAADDSIRQLIASSDRPVAHVVVTDPWVRKDLDYPEDLVAARRYLDARA